MPRDLDLTFDISTGALTLDRVVGNYVKRSETLTLSVTIVSNGASATIPSGLVGTLKPVNTYGTTLAQWTTFSQVGATNVYTASTTINAAAVTTLLGTTTEQANCVFDFAGAGVVESDTLALILKNNVTRDDDTAPTALLNRNDFLVSNGTGLLVNVAAGYAANGAFVAAQASLAITNATNYIEVTAAGVASVNTTAFTAGSYPLATVVASAGAITSNTDLRAWITPKPATGGVTSITGTANEITVTGTTTPTLSLPTGLTFTGKTVTGGTFASPSLTTPTIGDGTESAPSLSFTSDTDTGVYRPAADTVGIVGGGNDVVRLTGIASATDYLEVKNGIGVGSPLHVLAEGASANIGVHLQPKGSGLFTISDGTDFNKGIRFRSSSSAASAITLLDAVASAGRVVTLPDATGTLALVSGDLGTPSALVGTNITGTASGLTAGNATLAATVTVANEATDTSCFPLFATAATGSLAAKSNAGMTFNSATGLLSATGMAGAFNGTVGATTRSTGAFTTLTGTSSLTLGATGGTVGSVVLNGSTSGAASITVSATGVLAMPSGTYGNITSNGTMSAATVIAQNQSAAAIGIDISSLNSATQVTAGHPWMRVGGGASDSIIINAGAAGSWVDICGDLGSGLIVADGTGGHTTYLTTPATGTLRVTTNGSTLGTVDAATFTGNAATVTTNANLTGDVTSVGNATTLAAGSASALNSGTLAAARMANAGVHTGDATGTFPAITLNAAQTGITSVGTLTGGATGAGFTVALSTSTITGNLPDARNTVNNSTTTTLSALTTIGAAGAGTVNIPFTTAASSATVGAVTIGNGTAATNVGIGGGNVYAGGTITAVGQITGSSFRAYNGGIQLEGGGVVYMSTASGQLGLGLAGSPTSAQTIRPRESTGSNQAGASMTVQGGPSTGTGLGGSILFRTTPAGGSGSSANAAVTALTIDSTQAATFAGTLAVTGATTLTGNLTSNGAYISTPQALSGNGAVAAVNLTTEVTTIANTGTANTTTTLAAGTNGQKKVISFITDGGFDAVITVTNPAWGGAGTITMNDALDNIELRYLNSVWQVFINNGCTLA